MAMIASKGCVEEVDAVVEVAVKSVVLPPSRSEAEVAPAVDCWICEAV